MIANADVIIYWNIIFWELYRIQSSVQCENHKTQLVSQDCPLIHIHLSQSKHAFNTAYRTKIFIMDKHIWQDHMECSKISDLVWSLVHTEMSQKLKSLMLWSRQESKGPEPIKDHGRYPKFLDNCRIRSAWLSLFSPSKQRFGLEACLLSLDWMPWEQAAAEKQVNTDC